MTPRISCLNPKMAGRSLIVALASATLGSATGIIASIQMATGACILSGSLRTSAAANIHRPSLLLSNPELPFSGRNVPQPSVQPLILRQLMSSRSVSAVGQNSTKANLPASNGYNKTFSSKTSRVTAFYTASTSGAMSASSSSGGSPPFGLTNLSSSESAMINVSNASFPTSKTSSTESTVSLLSSTNISTLLSLAVTSSSQTIIVTTTSSPLITQSPMSTSTTSGANTAASSASSFMYTTGVRLSNPTAIFANPTTPDQYDDAAQVTVAGFPIEVYQQRSWNFTVSTNGLFVVGVANVENDNVHTTLYASALPAGSICVFWKDLIVRTAGSQGIYYQIDHYGADSQLSVEYILTAYDDGSDQQYYHIILVYDSDAVGLAELYYFSSGDGGANATIGAQGFDSMHVAQAITYDYNTPNTVVPGDRIGLVTDLNDDLNGTYTLRSFNDSCYPPGTWPLGICT